MLTEALGGWISNSLALLADAGHMFTDVAALSLTIAAIWFASKPATPRKTFGYYRLEILAAFINGIALALISLFVVYEAIQRLSEPPEIKGLEMTLIAVGGLVVNLVCAGLLHGDHKHDLNLRGAWLHVIGDALGSVAAIVAGSLVIWFGWTWADSVGSLFISVIIIYGAWNLIRESVNVLLEGAPAHINLKAVEESIRRAPNVEDVHDLHVWTITSGIEALSVHVVLPNEESQKDLLALLKTKLHEEFGIDHVTIQIESIETASMQSHTCFSGSNCFGSELRSRSAADSH